MNGRRTDSNGRWVITIAHCEHFMLRWAKNCLLWNYSSDFEIISWKCSLGNPFQKLFAKFWSVNKHGVSEWGLLALYRHKEILLNSSRKATKKKNGLGNFENAGERSRAILALLLLHLSSANAFNLDQSKILLSGNEIVISESSYWTSRKSRGKHKNLF